MASLIQIGAEDSYAIVDPIVEDRLAPDIFTMEPFGSAVADLRAWSTVWDFRRVGTTLYEDILAAYATAADQAATPGGRPTVLVAPDRVDYFTHEFEKRRVGLRPLTMPIIIPTEPKPLSSRAFDLTPFEERWHELREVPVLEDHDSVDPDLLAQVLEDDLRRDGIKAVELGIAIDEQQAMATVDGLLADKAFYEGLERFADEIANERRDILSEFLASIATNSLFSHIALHAEGDRIRVIPYHGHGVHDVDLGSTLLTVRPGRQGASTQWHRFASAITRLEELLNTPGVTEHEIELLLRENPLFLRGLNYTSVYHQVVLPLEDGSSLRPDIIAEPVGQGWAEVLDLKLPTESIYVGGGARPRLSAAIAEAATQLRSYTRYFDDRALAARIEKKYGIRCYKPRQTVIIGRDPEESNELRREAALTAYPDLRIISYDEMIRAARERLLF
jgi:hypothetical protein